jgi:hypothetical protein
MSKKATTELALVPSIQPTAILNPATTRTSPRTALRRCNAAWQRAFDAYMETGKGDGYDHIFAARKAGDAYCLAMPLLSGADGIRDFIACAAHGILINAILPKTSRHLFQAAQVALRAIPNTRRLPGRPPNN